jgi:predicted transcriptional regulator
MTDDMIAKARLLMPSYSISDVAHHLGVSRATIYVHIAGNKG